MDDLKKICDMQDANHKGSINSVDNLANRDNINHVDSIDNINNVDSRDIPHIFNMDTSYKGLPRIMYCKEGPKSYKELDLLILNEDLAKDLGLDIGALKSPYGIEVMAGARLEDEKDFPISQAYAGHQFGYFTLLGDGRAMLLGEHLDKSGRRHDIHLKGSGRTVYSRGGDGKASLGPMLREYLISEAMNELGIATSRSLAVLTTGESVYRNGMEPGAVLVRVADSHLRVGSFQFAALDEEGNNIKALADYTIDRHYPYLRSSHQEAELYLSLLGEIVKKQAKLVADWMLVGFIHGVMNTDNMTIAGYTIDYGPCAFMDIYDKNTVFSSIDRDGRYAYSQQPHMAIWDLSRLAETLLPLIADDQDKAIGLVSGQIEKFNKYYSDYFFEGMKRKLGLLTDNKEEDELLVYGLLVLMEKYKADYTNTFIGLTYNEEIDSELFKAEDFISWHGLWKTRLADDIAKGLVGPQDSFLAMKGANPAMIARNWAVDEALEDVTRKGDMTKFNRLLAAIKNPYDNRDDQKDYRKTRPSLPGDFKTYCGT